MRWYIGYPVLGAGLFFAAETFFPSAPAVSPPTVEIRHLTPTPGPVVVSASEIMDEPSARVARFSPGAVLRDAALPDEPSSGVLGYLAATFLPGRGNPPDAAAPTAPVTAAEWKSAIVRHDEPAGTPQQSEAMTKVALARALQVELQRLGCYPGKIDGVWGSGSRRAILSFLDRVNATLPTQEPDVFMLSLVRGHFSAVCSAAPEAIIADATPTGGASETHGRFEPTMARGGAPDRPPLPYGRMGIGGPRVDDMLTGTTSSGAPRLAGDGIARPTDTGARTAALDSGYSNGAQPPDLPVTNAAPSSFDTDRPLEPQRSKPSVSKAKVVRTAKPPNTYRQVQRLFTHPLGQM